MRKISFVLLLFSILLVSFNKTAYASLVVVNKEGDIVWKVLSEQDSIALDVPRHSYIEVKKAAETKPPNESVVTLTKKEDKVNLVVESDSETRTLDVTDWQEDIVEIEERAEVQKLKIGIKDDFFTLNQRGITAETEFPVSVDSKSAELSVLTSSGQKFISVLPFEAVESVLRTRIMNRLTGRNIKIIEQERELQYSINGRKVFSLFKLFEYSIPITMFVSASTGEVLEMDAPGWFKVISFLFT